MTATTYKHPLPHYAKVYGVSLSTIKRYARRGYPLDTPEDLAKQVGAQKNRPQGRSYRGAFGPAQKPNKREITAEKFAVLVMGQTMQCKTNRLLRKAEGMVSGPKWTKISADARKEAFNFVRYMVRREIQFGIMGMLKASAGCPLKTIREERVKADAEFRGDDGDSKE